MPRISCIPHEGGKGSDYCIVRHMPKTSKVQYWAGNRWSSSHLISWPHTPAGRIEACRELDVVLAPAEVTNHKPFCEGRNWLMAHTPGEWAVTKYAGGDWGIYAASEPGRGRDLAIVRDVGSETEFNAHAMRAGPELRLALTELELRTRQFLSGELVTFPVALLPQCRQAIEFAKP